YRGRAKKVVALDFDGLLWGGVIGEAGLGGIEIGEEGVGLAFQDLQRELLKLHDTGVLLVACSKNNPDDAFEVFERHPGMLLRREHFAAERVNWQDKATNLREIAEELSLGLDSFVFLDDSPVERTWVEQACPEVLVPELPADPSAYPAFLRAAPWFARISTTEADQNRAASYREQGRRRQSQQAAVSVEDFLVSLEQEAMIEPVHEGSLARAAQLCQRTNQFNATTKRYTAADLERMIADSDYELFTLAVRDRFGDSGITGLAILHHEGEHAVVDTFLMSCRILGRRLEDAFLAVLAERASARGATTLVGLFEPTAKNGLAAGFYADRGFEAAGDGVFQRDLQTGGIEAPPQIAIKVGSNA
ncbi:MAG: HAD-IIIC family phosphatase, partial [Actinomycetota bacterium]|nr:HAD-IIIC family phosphatase [Actinomycetota bacterium]